MLLKDMYNRDLAGFQIRYGYTMAIKFDGMGYYPAVTAESGRVVACFNREHLKKIWEKLPRRPVKVIKGPYLVNNETGVAAPFRTMDEDDVAFEDFFPIIKDFELQTFLEKEDFFRWDDSGLSVSCDDKVVFPEDKL